MPRPISTDGGTEGYFAYWAGVIAAFFTALYSWRLLIMTFHGKPRMDQQTWDHVHESPMVMWLPLVVLGHRRPDRRPAGSVAATSWATAWPTSGTAPCWCCEGHMTPIEAAHHVDFWVKLMPLLAAGSGIRAVLCRVHAEAGPAGHGGSAACGRCYLFILNKWYFDELFDLLFTRPAHRVGRLLWKSGDGGTIDRFGPDGIAMTARLVAQRASLLQSGYVYHYAFAMLIGVVVSGDLVPRRRALG